MGDSNVNVILGAKDQASKVVTGLRGQFETFKRDAQMGFGIGAGFSAFNMLSKGIGMATDFMADAVSMASDLEESQSKVNVVFGDGAGIIHDWGETAAESMGLTKQAALEAAGTFGNFIQALGNGQAEASEMSRGLVELAADLASFNNTEIDEVILALRSGLAGEAEPMRRLGVSLSAARVESNLLAKGIVKTKAEITDAMKVTERYAIIFEDSTLAQGDFARTSDGLANSTRILNAELADAQTEIGIRLLPVMRDLTNLLRDYLVPAVEGLGDSLDIVFGKGAESETQKKIRLLIEEATGLRTAFGELPDSIADVRSGLRSLSGATEDEGDAEKKAADEARALASALGLVAEGTKGARHESRLLEKAWDKLKGGPDGNKKAIRRLRDEVDVWGRRYRRALRDNDDEAAAVALANRDRAAAELEQRKDVAASMDVERAKLGDIKAAAENVPSDVPIHVQTVGEAAALASLERIRQRALSVLQVRVRLDQGTAGGPSGRPGQRRDGAHGAAYFPGDWGRVGERGEERIRNVGGAAVVSPMGSGRSGGAGHRTVIHTHVYLDRRQIAQAVDEGLGDRWSLTRAGDSYRSA